MINGFHLGEAENENSGGESATQLGVFAAATGVGGREGWPVPAAGSLLFLLGMAGRHSGAKKHMALDVLLQKQSERRNLMMYRSLTHPRLLPNIVTERLLPLDLPGGVILRGP